MTEDPNAYLAEHKRQVDALGSYLQDGYPDKQFSLVTDKGSSAAIYSDGEKIYKVFFEGADREYAHEEALILGLLSQEELCPKIHEYVEGHGDTQPASNPLPSPFQESAPLVAKAHRNIPVPVIVMDRVEFQQDGLRNLSDETLMQEFERIRDIARKHKLLFGDVEFVWDEKNKKVVLLDAAGVDKMDQNKRDNFKRITQGTPELENLSDDEIYEIELHWDLISTLQRYPTNYEGITKEKLHRWLRAGDYSEIRRMVTKDRTKETPDQITTTTNSFYQSIISRLQQLRQKGKK